MIREDDRASRRSGGDSVSCRKADRLEGCVHVDRVVQPGTGAVVALNDDARGEMTESGIGVAADDVETAAARIGPDRAGRARSVAPVDRGDVVAGQAAGFRVRQTCRESPERLILDGRDADRLRENVSIELDRDQLDPVHLGVLIDVVRVRTECDDDLPLGVGRGGEPSTIAVYMPPVAARTSKLDRTCVPLMETSKIRSPTLSSESSEKWRRTVYKVGVQIGDRVVKVPYRSVW